MDNYNILTKEVFIMYNNNTRKVSVSIDIDEYNKLIEENELLKKQLQENNGSIICEIVRIKDKTIDELKKENEELKLRISNLEKDIIDKDIRICNLEKDNKQLKKTVSFLENKEIYQKYMKAIQDANSYLLLEKKLDIPYCYLLEQFRLDRVDLCHFINKKDNEKYNNEKIEYIRRKILGMPDEIKRKFNRKYEGMIERILDILETYKIDIIQEDLEKIEEEWYDL
jgi:hypothetical protein